MKQPYELIPTNPCPFCGGKSKITCVRRGNYSRKGDNYQGLCNKCKARGPLVQDDPQEAADKWNAVEHPELTRQKEIKDCRDMFMVGSVSWNLLKEKLDVEALKD
jgi:hypothetical protein